MAHPELWPLIDAYADGQLPDADLPRLDRHLQDCEDCRIRLAGARREVALFRSALIAGPAPADLLGAIQAQINAKPGRARHPLVSGILAGMTANLITAALLVALSVGSRPSLALMSTIALVVALLWGAIKGLAFAAVREWLPGNVLIRGLVFGLGAWAVWNAVVGAVSTANSGMPFSTPVVLSVSLIHYVMYGLLVGWFYDLFGGRTESSSRPPGSPRGSPLPAMLLLLATLLAGSQGILASPTPASTTTTLGSQTAAGSPTVDLNATATDTPTDTPTDIPTDSATGSPTVGTTASSSLTVTATPSVTGTTPASPTTSSTTATAPSVTPAPSTTTVTPSPQPTATVKRRSRQRRIPESRRPVRDQVRDVLPTVIVAPSHRTAYQRVRDVAVLLDFL